MTLILQHIRTLVMLALALTGFNWPIHAQDQIEIRLATGSEQEKQTQTQLERILEMWDLSRWEFTRIVLIQSGVIPHSHPVLTLNTNSLTEDTIKVKSFIHEQLHWFLSGHHAAADSAIADLAKVYPDAPDDAGDRESTYLHLLIGVLEFDTLRELFGEATARRLIARTPFYTWVYREVLEHQEWTRSILKKYRLDLPDART